ncbi:MAG TPA: hypothetical protein VHP33_02625 [Polyangiaceae bacterium]|nr:hypothetical protein [Polyangiaceae bacterium]
MAITKARLFRLAGVAGLVSYCFLLLAASFPVALLPWSPLATLELGSAFVLHFVGITPGLEVFPGRNAVRAIPFMTCFRVTGEGPTPLVLFDNLERCRNRRVDAVRDSFEVLLAKSLSGPLLDIDLGHRRSLAQEPMQPLFLLTDYFCHVPQAEQAGVTAVRVDGIYLGLNLDDGSKGQVNLGGRRACARPSWEIRQP